MRARVFFPMIMIAAGPAVGQCPNNNVLTGAAVTPVCSGTTTVPCVQAGQYALINVVAGNVYTFSTCGGTTVDTEITLYNNAGGGAIGYNDDGCGLQSTVTWSATFTGQLRVLIDAFPCVSSIPCSALTITCTAPPVGTDCIYVLNLTDGFGDGWGSSFVGVSINGGPFTNYSVTGLSNTVTIGVNIGDVIVLSYNNSGPFQGENAYTLALQGGGTLYNSGSPPTPGISYTGTVNCTPPPPAPEDCLGAVTICSNVAFSNNTTNEGNHADITVANSGCLDDVEYQGTWYIFSPSASGNLGFTISPLGPDDYDWAVWGPFPTGTTLQGICPPTGTPIRCAASSGPATLASTGSYATGMGHATYSPPQFASTGVSYGIPATFDACPLVPPQRCGWVPGMQVTAGQVFLLYISNWSQSSTGFGLNWNLQNGASLDCTVLPVELVSFDAEAMDDAVRLEWSTASERNSDRFEIERSVDGDHFEMIGEVASAGNSTSMRHYAFIDGSPRLGLSHYRLRQVDIDGEDAYSPARTVRFHKPGAGVQLLPNPGSDLVSVLIPYVDPGSQLVMLDATGREVLRMLLEKEHTVIDLGHLPRGFYAIRALRRSGEVAGNSVWVRE